MNSNTSRLDLEQIRRQAKELVKGVRAADPGALQRALTLFPATHEFALTSAQLVIARENGFASWADLRRALVAANRPDRYAELFDAIDALDVTRVEALLAASPNLAGASRKTDYGGWETALHAAARKGSLELSKVLVEAGAVVYAVNQGDYPPVFEAHYSRNQELVSYLLAKSIETDGGAPPTFGCGIDIVCASRIGMADRVRMHVEKDPFAVYRRGCIGETVLHWPSHNGHVAIVEFLLESGAQIEADEIGLYGGKPLHWAAEHEPSTLRVLLKHGANPNSLNQMPGEFLGYTPLHMTAHQRNECIENVDLLLAAGADPHALDALGRTPLEVAVAQGHKRMEAHLRAKLA